MNRLLPPVGVQRCEGAAAVGGVEDLIAGDHQHPPCFVAGGDGLRGAGFGRGVAR